MPKKGQWQHISRLSKNSFQVQISLNHPKSQMQYRACSCSSLSGSCNTLSGDQRSSPYRLLPSFNSRRQSLINSSWRVLPWLCQWQHSMLHFSPNILLTRRGWWSIWVTHMFIFYRHEVGSSLNVTCSDTSFDSKRAISKCCVLTSTLLARRGQ